MMNAATADRWCSGPLSSGLSGIQLCLGCVSPLATVEPPLFMNEKHPADLAVYHSGVSAYVCL